MNDADLINTAVTDRRDVVLGRVRARRPDLDPALAFCDPPRVWHGCERLPAPAGDG